MNKLLFAILVLCLSACASVNEKQRKSAQNFAISIQDQQIICVPDFPCGIDSPFQQQAQQNYTKSNSKQPKHTLIMLDQGHDALLLRLHMIESAKQTIELQMFIFDLDESGTLVLDALVRAAKRGVKVRVLFDQLYGLNRPKLQAKLAAIHKNFELKLYSPMFDQAEISSAEFFAGIVFQYQSLNQRMHTKLLLVDDQMAIIGGRNIQDRYFDWDKDYNYRDRDVWVAGEITQAMKENFEAFWLSDRSYSATRLDDVVIQLERAETNPEYLQVQHPPYSERMRAMQKMSENGIKVWAELQPYLHHVGAVKFYADLPEKHHEEPVSHALASNAVYEIITKAQHSVIMQTPYLVMSRIARQTFRMLQRREAPVRVWVSTNSLAATDAFPVYALSHKYKRLYLRELGFRIYEFKPFPESAYMRVGQDMGWLNEELQPDSKTPDIFGYTGSGPKAPLPLTKKGVRAGLHSKSLVIDGQVSVIGSHNFDPRSDGYNTESMLVVDNPYFSNMLSASIRNDMRPDNSWAIAPREALPAIADFNYSMGKFSEKLPVFDIWPWPYATSYQLKTECAAIAYDDPAFEACAEAVGDFPEVNMSLKAIYTRIISAFGASLEPIL
ncbi:MAG TPA: phospholipase D family protein [Arenimonas sp.]|nr:phospholipase D family protein [Arenimonas sp.]